MFYNRGSGYGDRQDILPDPSRGREEDMSERYLDAKGTVRCHRRV
jgi:hypothetical protein